LVATVLAAEAAVDVMQFAYAAMEQRVGERVHARCARASTRAS
jgi:hypothetical protein